MGRNDQCPYVFDTSAFHTFRHYYRPTFDPVWELLDSYVETGRIISVSEVQAEIERGNSSPLVLDWVKDHKKLFARPTEQELAFVASIFAVAHFQQLVSRKARYTHGPVADPFVIAAGACRKACVVTLEVYKENGAKIPNVCEHFDVECIDMEEFFRREQWLLSNAGRRRRG